MLISSGKIYIALLSSVTELAHMKIIYHPSLSGVYVLA
jgi:hypothetical protein